MIVLGIHAFIHDSGACAVSDGKICAISEERLDRVKRSAAFPFRSIEYVLSEIGIKDINRVDLVVFDLFEREGKETLKGVRATGYKGRVETVRHHDAHAASAYFASPFDEAAVLIVDGAGSDGTEYPDGQPPHFLAGHLGWMQEVQSVYRGAGPRIHLSRRTFATPDFSLGPGFLYGLTSELLGFGKLEGGKLMGLAAYGKERRRFPENIFADCSGDFLIRSQKTADAEKNMESLFESLGIKTPKREPKGPLTQQHNDLALFVQRQTENVMLALARHAREITGSKNLCMAGGVALNGLANLKILEESGFESLFVQPAANDAGIPLGCALHGYHEILGGKRRFRMKHAFLGRRYGKREVEAALNKYKQSLSIQRPGNIAKMAAHALDEGKIVGLFSGGSEFGPRALGARSILADPRRSNMKDILNSRVKFREPFRPYAPAVLEGRESDFFRFSGQSPYMLLVAPVKSGAKRKIPAAVHEDGTARLQTVDQKTNPAIYAVIREFDKIAGLPMAINTSMNISGEPIVETPEEALNCLLNTGLDALALEDWWVEKGNETQPETARQF